MKRGKGEEGERRGGGLDGKTVTSELDPDRAATTGYEDREGVINEAGDLGDIGLMARPAYK